MARLLLHRYSNCLKRLTGCCIWTLDCGQPSNSRSRHVPTLTFAAIVPQHPGGLVIHLICGLLLSLTILVARKHPKDALKLCKCQGRGFHHTERSPSGMTDTFSLLEVRLTKKFPTRGAIIHKLSDRILSAARSCAFVCNCLGLRPHERDRCC